MSNPFDQFDSASGTATVAPQAPAAGKPGNPFDQFYSGGAGGQAAANAAPEEQGSPTTAKPATASVAPTPPEFKAAPPQPGIGSKILTEIRNAISPIVGETDQQRLDRESAAAQLEKISPTLGALVRQSQTERGEKVASEGAAKSISDEVMPTLKPLAAGAINVGLTTLGGITGAAGGTLIEPGPGTIVGGGAGASYGNYSAQKLNQALGLQDRPVDYGEVAGSGIGGSVPGGSLARGEASATGNFIRGLFNSKAAPLAGEAIAEQGVKQGVAGLAAITADTEIDQRKLPTAKEATIASALPALAGSFAQHLEQISPEISAARTAALAQNGEKRGILAAARNEGFVVRPSSVNPSRMNVRLESIAGGPSVDQAAIPINNKAADEIAKRILNPTNPSDVQLTSDVARQVRNQAYQIGYQPIALSGKVQVDQQYANDLRDIYANHAGAANSFPNAVPNDVKDLVKNHAVTSFDPGDGLKIIQNLRNQSGQSYASGNHDLATAQRAVAGALEDQLERHLAIQSSTGPSTALTVNGSFPTNAASQQQAASLIQNFRDARKLMAQSHDIEDAIREGSGSIVPSRLGVKFENQKPLSGGLKTIGGFANNFKGVSGEAAAKNVAGTTATGRLIPLLAGLEAGSFAGMSGHGGTGALIAAGGLAVPAVRGAVRKLLLSGPYQRIMAQIPVNVKASPDLTALAVRQGSQAAGQEAAESTGR